MDAIITGWGVTETGREPFIELKKAKLKIRPDGTYFLVHAWKCGRLFWTSSGRLVFVKRTSCSMLIAHFLNCEIQSEAAMHSEWNNVRHPPKFGIVLCDLLVKTLRESFSWSTPRHKKSKMPCKDCTFMNWFIDQCKKLSCYNEHEICAFQRSGPCQGDSGGTNKEYTFLKKCVWAADSSQVPIWKYIPYSMI